MSKNREPSEMFPWQPAEHRLVHSNWRDDYFRFRRNNAI